MNSPGARAIATGASPDGFSLAETLLLYVIDTSRELLDLTVERVRNQGCQNSGGKSLGHSYS